ncbi:hypothetical protein MCOR27_001908 [Pyricularia oryzae]|uniref:Cytochrome P450 n=2 Tax=Pyricularia TaxID=48558 RepID=A0ABQ8NW19_PYRGI|nr:hypothetical protein MCOR01_001187 [Pyricularia oryzae]KAI6302435.1 hypothetical protein MCOR33_002181 [Pyricularia grisea]KAH9430279.1 hypothetical protein MCOR02_009996 [Pyricularia oryzae]KAI6256423.1 hypothetical protein MCOR19_007088 [Pyricularia oryzae]KAI6275477.1 hypothetical protein MCOR26_005998 [Pyricularia oryzae]
MDIQTCAVLSALETVAWVGFHEYRSLALTTRKELVAVFSVFFLVQYFCAKIYRIFIYPVHVSPLRHLPTPKGNHFMLGQLVNQFRASCPNELYLKWTSQWPDSPFVRFFTIGNKESLLINGIEANREVFATHCYAFTKPSLFLRFVGDIAGTGLLFTEGDEHKRHRKMILNVFSVPNLKKMFPIFQEKAEELSQHLDATIAASTGDSIDVQCIYSKATIDIIGITALGLDLRNLKSTKLRMDFLQCYRRMHEQPFSAALISFINVHVPIRRLLWFVRANRDFVEASQEVRAMLRTCIRERIRDVDSRKGAEVKFQSRDLLTYMVEERLLAQCKDPLTTEDILGHLLNFLSAGHETTTGVMTWASYVLATNPRIQDRLRAEVEALLKESPCPSYSDIERMKYMHNFVREVLRLYSPAVATYREAAKDVTICGTLIPKGTHLVLCPSVCNKSKRIWGADAEEFVPERWEKLDGEAASPYSIMTFLAGPRQCIGKQYALQEVKVLLIEVISKFRLLPTEELVSNDFKVNISNPGVVLRPKGGMVLRVERL